MSVIEDLAAALMRIQALETRLASAEGKLAGIGEEGVDRAIAMSDRAEANTVALYRELKDVLGPTFSIAKFERPGTRP